MRLIDADALLSECKLEQKQASYDRQYANAFYSASGDISTEWWCIEDMIENAPTIEEWKKGKWIYKHCVWFCSECGENPTKGMGYVQGHQELYDFCPKCGADMRGTGDNSDE